MSDHQDVKRYAMPVLGQRESKTGYWMRYDDYDRDIKVLEADNKQLHELLKQWADGYDHTTPIEEPLWELYKATRELEAPDA